MKTRLISLISLALSCILTALPAYAQLSPNPNPDGNTITVSGNSTTGATNFENYGTLGIQASGTLTVDSGGSLRNQSTGYLRNDGAIINYGRVTLYNVADNNGRWELKNRLYIREGTVLNNNGTVVSDANDSSQIQPATNSVINNKGVMATYWLQNRGIINNSGYWKSGHCTGTDCYLTNKGDGTINNTGIMETDYVMNRGAINNKGDGNIINIGYFRNYRDGAGSLGLFNNEGRLENKAGATLVNDWEMNNTGTFINDGEFNNRVTGSFTNETKGLLVNNNLIKTEGNFVNKGMLLNSGNIEGDVINSGTIALGDTLTKSGAMVQDIKVTHITGNFTNTRDGNLNINVDASGNSDRMHVTGIATLEGGMVNVQAAAGQYQLGTVYRFLLTESGVAGTFSGSKVLDSAFLMADLLYDKPAEVDLIITRNGTSFQQVRNLTENELRVAESLDSIVNSGPAGDMSNVISGLLLLNEAQARNAYDQMGGLIHTTIGEVTFLTMNRYFGTMSNRMGGFLTGGPAWNYSLQPVNLASLDTITDAGNTILAVLGNNGMDKAPVWGLWAQGYGGLADINDTDISSRYDYKTGGIVVGFDKQLSQPLLLGVSVGYSSSRIDLKDLSEFANGRGFQLSGYGIYNKPDWYFSTILGYSFIHYDTTRNMSFAGITRTADADYNTNAFGACLEGGYKILTKDVDIIPMVSLTSGYMLRDSFDEQSAGALDLDAKRAYSSYFLGSLGMKFRKDLTGSWGTTTPEFTVRWDHRLTNDRLALNANFSGYPNAPFTTKGDLPDTDSLGVGLGLTWKTKDNVDISVSYDGSFSGNNMVNAGTVSLKYLW